VSEGIFAVSYASIMGLTRFYKNDSFFTGSTARSASRRYLIYSEADFEVFRHAGATRCTDGSEIWHGVAKFHPHRRNDKGVGPQKLKFLLRFDQNMEYKRPAERIPCATFTKFAVCTPFQLLKFGCICSRGYGVMGVLSWGTSGYPQIFSAP